MDDKPVFTECFRDTFVPPADKFNKKQNLFKNMFC